MSAHTTTLCTVANNSPAGAQTVGDFRLKGRSETDPELGKLRMATLVPYVEKRMGITQPDSSAPTNSLRADMAMLKRKLHCGEDFIRACIRLIHKEGPQNVMASQFLRRAPSSRGSLKISPELRELFDTAVRVACVERELVHGTALSRKAVQDEMLKAGVSADRIPCNATIDKRCKRSDIIIARTTKLNGDHMTRMMNLRKLCVSAHRIVIVDVTTFTSGEKDKSRLLYVLDDEGRILGLANSYFGLQGGSRDIWSLLPFVGAPNATLTGFALHQGFLSKDSIYKELGMTPQMTPCGKPAQFYHDLGSENVNAHITRVLDDVGVLFEDFGPGALPEFRGDLERFHRTAHRMFDTFLESTEGRRYFVPVPGIPGAAGIRMRDLRPAMWRWALGTYRHSAHKGIGGATPAERFEDFVRGRHGFPASGYLGGMEDTKEFRWLFMRERWRTITHLGIEAGCDKKFGS